MAELRRRFLVVDACTVGSEGKLEYVTVIVFGYASDIVHIGSVEAVEFNSEGCSFVSHEDCPVGA